MLSLRNSDCLTELNRSAALNFLIPAATTLLVYYFVGSFIAGHILLTAAIAAILGGFQYPAADRP
jgi:hypothetical protein